MSAVDRLASIEARMNRQIPALDIRDRNDLRGTVEALRAVLAACDFAEDHPTQVIDDENLVATGVIRSAITEALDSAS